MHRFSRKLESLWVRMALAQYQRSAHMSALNTPVHLDFTLFGENLYLTSFGYGTAARRMEFLEAA